MTVVPLLVLLWLKASAQEHSCMVAPTAGRSWLQTHKNAKTRNAHDTLFLWRAFPATKTWISPHSTHGTTAELLTRPSLVSDKQSYYVKCDGSPSSYIEAASPISTDGGVTILAWVQAQDVERRAQTIFSNHEAGQRGGFSLHLEGSKVCGQVDGEGTRHKACGGQVEAHQWHLVGFRVHMFSSGGEDASSNPGTHLSIYLDGEVMSDVGAQNEPGFMPILNSHVKPLICASAKPLSEDNAQSNFAGFVHAIHVANYPYSEKFLNVRLAFDGMTYMGLPSYHDGDWSRSVEQRIDWPSGDNSDALHVLSFVPFANDEYIVQGVASSCEAAVSPCTQEKLYLSLYYKNTEGKTVTTDNYENNTMLVAELDASTGRLTRCWKMSPDAGKKERESHAGGIAYFDDYLYITSNGKDCTIYKYDISPARESSSLTSSSTSSSCGTMKSIGSFPVRASSFVSTVQIEKTRYIMTGKFCKDSENCKYQDGRRRRRSPPAKPYAYAYLLDEATGDIDTSSYMKYRLPYRAQGVDVDPLHQDLLVSMSYGDKQSQFRKYPLQECPYGESCDELQQSCPALMHPAGAEDLAMTSSGRLWSASESSARHYQKRARAWNNFFPFVYYTIPVWTNFSSVGSSTGWK